MIYGCSLAILKDLVTENRLLALQGLKFQMFQISSCNLAHSILNLDFYGDNNLSIGIWFKYHVNELAKQKYSYYLFRENSDSTTEPSLELNTSFGTQETSEVS